MTKLFNIKLKKKSISATIIISIFVLSITTDINLFSKLTIKYDNDNAINIDSNLKNADPNPYLFKGSEL
ncbi:MAG: hypothetical protein ACFFA6_15310, partial [Promethearchaeota archaeon]